MISFLSPLFSHSFTSSSRTQSESVVIREVVVDTANCFLSLPWLVAVSVRVSKRMDLRSLKSVFVIAEIGQNHQGDISVAKEVIKVSLIKLICIP